VTTTTPEQLDAALARCGRRRVIVAGGDGSLHLVVSRLHALGTLAAADLALVPLGTGNDLARSLGIPLEPVAAARLALTGTARPLDLLVDDAGGLAVNAVHLGVGAEAAQAAGRFKRVLGPLAYPLGAVAAGLRVRGERLRVEVNGRLLAGGHRGVLMVGIGNGPGIGGGTPLLPHAVPDDGLLDVMVCTATGPLARVGFGRALRAGEHLRSPHVRSARGRTVTVSGGPVELNADGEVGESVVRRTWSVEPGAWRLVRP
jgi:YegS/Rv2252/BmrU family lipid kinase